jgi:opacity protein-like surface antigen
MNIKKILASLVVIPTMLSASAYADACETYIKLGGGYGQYINPVFAASGSMVVGQQGPSPITGTFTNFGTTNKLNGGFGQVAVGYGFTDNLRGELEFDYAPNSNVNIDRFQSNFKFTTMNLMANMYYDFAEMNNITPFVFAGIGGERMKTKVTPMQSIDPIFGSTMGTDQMVAVNQVYTPTAFQNALGTALPITSNSITFSSKNAFAYQAGFGISMQANEWIEIEGAYVVKGAAKTNNIVNNISILEVSTAASNKDKISSNANTSTYSGGTYGDLGTNNVSLQQVNFGNSNGNLEQAVTLSIKFGF